MIGLHFCKIYLNNLACLVSVYEIGAFPICRTGLTSSSCDVWQLSRRLTSSHGCAQRLRSPQSAYPIFCFPVRIPKLKPRWRHMQGDFRGSRFRPGWPFFETIVANGWSTPTPRYEHASLATWKVHVCHVTLLRCTEIIFQQIDFALPDYFVNHPWNFICPWEIWGHNTAKHHVPRVPITPTQISKLLQDLFFNNFILHSEDWVPNVKVRN